MGFGVKTWIFAAAAAVLNTFAMFYAGIFGAPRQPYSTEVSPAAGIAVFLAGAAALAEYIYFGRKDVGRERIYRFVQHNVLSFVCSYIGFVIYSAAGFREHYVPDTTVFNALLPRCFQQFFLETGIAAIVCVIISAVKKRRHKDRENDLARKQVK